ncbi:MAG: sulfotransferase [Bacteroidota bacterium]|nr:sulfotransferase [Bacteroidota bacterium]
MYTKGRTGSNVLANLLSCHPEVFCDHELFHSIYADTKVIFPYLYIRSRSKSLSEINKSVYGFRVKRIQLQLEHKYKNYKEILQKFYRKDWKFIYLVRENHLRHRISNLISAQTQIYHLKKLESLSIQKISVNCNELLKSIKLSEQNEQLEKWDLENIQYIKIVYEKDLLNNNIHQVTADKIFNFLGLSNHKVETDYRKATPEKLEDLIINYEEVFQFFKDTKYAKFLL